MAKPLKEKGLAELRAFRQRAFRQASLERISESDFSKLNAMVNDIIQHVESMEEEDDSTS